MQQKNYVLGFGAVALLLVTLDGLIDARKINQSLFGMQTDVNGKSNQNPEFKFSNGAFATKYTKQNKCKFRPTNECKLLISIKQI